jgi:hypothetical protein
MDDPAICWFGGGSPPRIMEELSTSFSIGFPSSVFHGLALWETLWETCWKPCGHTLEH